MDEIQDRLARCFSSVFPDLLSEQIRAATAESLPEWDSLASVTLVAVLQEEFAVEIDFGDLPELNSFDAVLCYLGKRGIPRNGHG